MVTSNDTYYKNARFTLKTWTGQETELGTLKTYTETRFNFGNNVKRLSQTSPPRLTELAGRQQERLAELRLDPARWPARR